MRFRFLLRSIVVYQEMLIVYKQEYGDLIMLYPRCKRSDV